MTASDLIWMVVGVMVIGFTLLCNGYVLIDYLKEGISWHQYVTDEQEDSKFGQTCMKIYYFIPSLVSLGRKAYRIIRK